MWDNDAWDNGAWDENAWEGWLVAKVVGAVRSVAVALGIM
jgi:hypothetical protein